MKKVVFISLCLFGLGWAMPSLYARETIKGNKKLVTKEITSTDFERVIIKGPNNGSQSNSIFKRNKGNFEFEYTQATEAQGITITMDENLFDLLVLNEMDGKVELRLGKENEKIKPSKILIKGTSAQLKEFKMQNLCMDFIASAPLITDSLELGLEGVGDFYIENLTCTYLKGRIEGVGNMNLAGTVQDGDIRLEGVGKLNAFDCNFRKMNGVMSGVGKMHFHVEEDLYARLEGVGTIRYTGNPSHRNTNSEGIGRIKHVK